MPSIPLIWEIAYLLTKESKKYIGILLISKVPYKSIFLNFSRTINLHSKSKRGNLKLINNQIKLIFKINLGIKTKN